MAVGKIKQMTRKDGHVTTTWDTEVEETVAQAEAIFREAVKTAPVFEMVNAAGEKTQVQVREWDENAQEYLIVLQPQGG